MTGGKRTGLKADFSLWRMKGKPHAGARIVEAKANFCLWHMKKESAQFVARFMEGQVIIV